MHIMAPSFCTPPLPECPSLTLVHHIISSRPFLGVLLVLLRSGLLIYFFSVSFLYHLNYAFLTCLESTCHVMDATTNNALVLSSQSWNSKHNKVSQHQSWEKKPKALTLKDHWSTHWPTNSLAFSSFTMASFTRASSASKYLLCLSQVWFIHTSVEVDHKSTGIALKLIKAIFGSYLFHILNPQSLHVALIRYWFVWLCNLSTY